MTGELPDPGAFGAAFQDFMETMIQAATRPESPLAVQLREHLGADPSALPSTVAELATTDHPNLQLALDAVLIDAEVVGYSTRHSAFGGVGLADIIAGMSMAGPIRQSPVQRVAIEVGDGRVVRCVTMGMYLAQRDGVPVALVISRGERPWGGTALKLEAVSPDADAAPKLLAHLRAAMREHNVYRGKVISLHQREDQAVSVQFHRLPEIARDAVILPDGTLERLERQALGVAQEADRLRAAGRHLKRGVLLHGPPGTGKTLSVTYLLGAMPGRTTVLLTGRGLGLIEQAVGIARELAPATVVFEDVDLVAGERTMEFGAGGGILFELLNQMEGLEDDADLLFVLTTNRPDLIEPALAARPGRVDLALEVPLRTTSSPAPSASAARSSRSSCARRRCAPRSTTVLPRRPTCRPHSTSCSTTAPPSPAACSASRPTAQRPPRLSVPPSVRWSTRSARPDCRCRRISGSSSYFGSRGAMMRYAFSPSPRRSRSSESIGSRPVSSFTRSRR
jgi:cell division protease FtsH